MSVLDVTQTNSTTGAGVIDSWHSVASEIEELKTAHGSDRAAIAVELGISAAGAVLDTVAFALDPLAKLISAGLGWLIEHVSFLRWPLDQIAGNPDQIKVLADGLHTIGQDLRNAAADFDAALTAQIKGWQGAGYDSFRNEMTGHRTHMDDAGKAVDTAGYVVETTMAIISAVRSLFRDIITTVLGDIIATMLTALALAAITFGASIPVGVAKCVAEGTIQATSMATKLAKVATFAGRVADRLKQLSGLTKGDAPAGASGSSAVKGPATSIDNAPNTHSGDPAPSTHTPDPAPNTHASDSVGDPAHPTDSTDTPGNTPGNTPGSQTGAADEEDPFATWLAADQHFNGPGAGHDNAPSVHDDAPSVHDDTSSVHDDSSSGHDDSSSVHDETPPGQEENPATNTAGDDPPGTPAEQPGNAPATHDENTGTTESSNTPAGGQDTPAPAPAPKPPDPKSLARDQDISILKKHEDWLKKNFGDSQAKAKFFDNWVKKNAPDSYPLIKAMADSKSSKNFVGWVGKDIINVDKQLTDIQQRAEDDWQRSEEKWRSEHPDPAAGA